MQVFMEQVDYFVNLLRYWDCILHNHLYKTLFNFKSLFSLACSEFGIEVGTRITIVMFYSFRFAGPLEFTRTRQSCSILRVLQSSSRSRNSDSSEDPVPPGRRPSKAGEWRKPFWEKMQGQKLSLCFIICQISFENIAQLFHVTFHVWVISNFL